MNKIEFKGYTYDDVQIIPCDEPCVIASRKGNNLNTTSRLSKRYNIMLPFVASPMDTICGVTMAKKMMELGCVGYLHRFDQVDIQIGRLQFADFYDLVHVAIGKNDFDRLYAILDAGISIQTVMMDTAHGNHLDIIEMIENFKKNERFKRIDIIAGSVAHGVAAKNLVDAGADGIRVGIGNGSRCTTRLTTGVGIPTITSIMDVREAIGDTIPIVADGGIRYPGDVCKAIVAGANTVILGNALAGSKETPGNIIHTDDGAFKTYRGSASYESKIARGESDMIEGVSSMVPIKGSVVDILNRFEDGLRSSMAYVNARNMKEFYEKGRFCSVTNAGITEAKPHGIIK
jgi:IMP dehydrogenase